LPAGHDDLQRTQAMSAGVFPWLHDPLMYWPKEHDVLQVAHATSLFPVPSHWLDMYCPGAHDVLHLPHTGVFGQY
jgi:hypothetical protein